VGEAIVDLRPKGGNDLVAYILRRLPNPLRQETLARLRGFFRDKGHQPSEAMWTALTELASVLEAMANGTCPPKMFLSSLDPGVGKTQTITHFIRTLMASEAHQDVGVVICLSRLAEIKALTAEMGLERTDFAVLTSDPTLNALGNCPVNEARVLFTTQKRIELLGAGHHFDGIEAFHFHGRARQVRLWDESILPGQTVTLSRDDIALLPRALRLTHPALADAIDDFGIELLGVEDGALHQVPDFSALAGKKVIVGRKENGVTSFDHLLDLNAALGLIAHAQPQELLQQTLTALWLLAGKPVSVRRDQNYGNTVLDYHESLPTGLAPMVVLDASGRVRETYRQWEENRGELTRLTEASKHYGNLTVHCWRTGGGKQAFRNNGTTLLDGVVATINAKPDEDWLVVHHKDGIKVDFEKAVTTRLVMGRGRVHFIHWGEHQATNDYADVPNVILAGTLFYRPSHYEALTRLAGDK
jgi:hypothetical protein